MNFSELALVILVTLVVFGPQKLPMLAQHLGELVRKINQWKHSIIVFWQAQQNELQLLDNERKARKADAQYADKEQ